VANVFNVEVYITELDPMGNSVQSWTVEGHDMKHLDEVRYLLTNTGSLFESCDLEPDPPLEELDDGEYYDDLEPDPMDYDFSYDA
jgi:hypothetical protein